MEGYAEYYSAELSEKVKRGMTENALKAKSNGVHPPFGYYVDDTDHYQIDETTAPLVKEIYALFLDGKKPKELISLLSERGITHGKYPISYNFLYRILTNRKYIGESNSIIAELDITNCQFGHECIIKDCIIEKIIGVSNSSGLPNGIRDNEIDTFQSINTNAKVRAANLKPAQEILITILRKVVNNIKKGNGRKEEALLRGLAEKDKKLRDKILNKLLTEDILSKHQGDEGYIYSPNRKESNRVKKLLDELTLSDDPLWTYVSNL